MDLMPHARLKAVIAAVLALALAAAGCSSDDGDEAPAACLTGSDAYLAALEAAPGEVRLEGETPISECLTPGQEGGELAQVGKEMIDTATVLNSQARENPADSAPVQLGYLVGAVEKGAAGIHADLVRRLQAAANFSPDPQLPAAFEAGFAKGYAAGRDSG